MNYFKVFLALTGGASLVSTASFNVFQLSTADFVAIDGIIRERDDAERIREILHDGCRLKYDSVCGRLMRHMVEQDRPKSFAFLYSCIDSIPDNPCNADKCELSDQDKSDLLVLAYRNHSVGIFDFMLGIDFVYYYWISFWPLDRSWTSRELRDLLAGHPQKARLFACSLFSATPIALDVEEALDKIAINLLCAGDLRYQPMTMLSELIRSNYVGTDEGFAKLFGHLIDAGGVVTEQMQAVFARKHPNHEIAKNTLLYAIHPEIKEPADH
jgi:hypothetical protein